MADHERRYLPTADLRILDRGKGAPSGIAGYAAVFDEWTTLHENESWTLREIIRPGAFKNAIAEGQDVRALLNHDPNHVLGRTRSNTLRLTEDARGLFYDVDLAATQTNRDLVLSPIERGDISGSSFAFLIRPGGQRSQRHEEGGRVVIEQELTDVDLFDVSPVTYPAYKQTDVAMRAWFAQYIREWEEFHKRRAARLAAAEIRLRSIEALLEEACT